MSLGEETCKQFWRLSKTVGGFLGRVLQQHFRAEFSVGVSGSRWASSSVFASTFSVGSATGSTTAFLLLALGFFIATTLYAATLSPPLRHPSYVDNVDGPIRPLVARTTVSHSRCGAVFAAP